MSQRKVSLAAAVKTALAVNMTALSLGVPQAVFAEETVIEEVVVTGSRIPRNDLTVPSPVAV